MMTVRHAWIGLLLCGLGCAGTQRNAAHGKPEVPPAALLSPSALGYDFQWRQRVSARWPTGQQGFDAVLQKQHAELLLVGLSPMGLPGFVFRLRESGAVEVENRSGRELPFEARYVLVDVQRVFFPWLEGPAPQTGERSGTRGDSRVSERYVAGKLVSRQFERATPHGLERVTVAYHGFQDGADAPARAVLQNSLLRYTLTIDTLQQSRLTP